MKYRMLWLLFAFAAAAPAGAAEPPGLPLLAPSQQQPHAAHLAAEVLTRYDYKSVSLDIALSEKVFDRYLLALDPAKLYFTQADVDWFAGARSNFGEAIYDENLQVPFDIFNVYERRFSERFAYARELLKQQFDFSISESLQVENGQEAWPDSEEDLCELWRKHVKNDWLRLKLAGNKDDVIRNTLDRRYANFLLHASRTDSEDVFQIFMDTYATSIEPHTDYLGLKASEEFDIQMSLSMVGIGAVLVQKDDYLVIAELLPGGPAALSGKLKIGDRLIGIAQGRTGAMVDVVGWRVEDAADLARGAKGSLVRLEVLPVSAGPEDRHKVVILARNKIDFEEEAARKSILQVQDGAATRHVGVITLPSFYQDIDAKKQGKKNFKSASRDVARLLDELKGDNVEAILVDLRDNGGGSLDEAIEMTGLFIGKGPVVQTRNAEGELDVQSTHDAKPAWSGPLGVLIDRGSASASEIFAAAIQDYGRGIIIGEPSFGKGTVQTIVNLDQMAHSDKPEFGELKMTIAQFFRVNGGTTQLRGVTPDIGLPGSFDTDRFGESSFDNALPWMRIKPANYTPVGDLTRLLPLLQNRHALRTSQDRDFQYLEEDIAALKLERNKAAISLNEAERRKERDTQDARFKSRARDDSDEVTDKHSASEENASVNPSDLPDNGLELGEGDISQELATAKMQREVKDIRLNEAAHILGDEVTLQGADTRLAERAGR
jgi:carboxyl-terminal processing protease